MEEIENPERRIKIKNFYAFTPSWNQDERNNALFVEFESRFNKFEETYVWLVSESEFFRLMSHFAAVSLTNRLSDKEGKKFQEKVKEVKIE